MRSQSEHQDQRTEGAGGSRTRYTRLCRPHPYRSGTAPKLRCERVSGDRASFSEKITRVPPARAAGVGSRSDAASLCAERGDAGRHLRALPVELPAPDVDRTGLEPVTPRSVCDNRRCSGSAHSAGYRTPADGSTDTPLFTSRVTSSAGRLSMPCRWSRSRVATSIPRSRYTAVASRSSS